MNEKTAEQMQKQEQPTNLLDLADRLRELRKEQARATGDQWTEEKRRELVKLEGFMASPTLTQEQQNLLKRQAVAGINNNPPLTGEERTALMDFHLEELIAS